MICQDDEANAHSAWPNLRTLVFRSSPGYHLAPLFSERDPFGSLRAAHWINCPSLLLTPTTSPNTLRNVILDRCGLPHNMFSEFLRGHLATLERLEVASCWGNLDDSYTFDNFVSATVLRKLTIINNNFQVPDPTAFPLTLVTAKIDWPRCTPSLASEFVRQRTTSDGPLRRVEVHTVMDHQDPGWRDVERKARGWGITFSIIPPADDDDSCPGITQSMFD